MTPLLSGQSALVTGGDSGIGAEVCRALFVDGGMSLYPAFVDNG